MDSKTPTDISQSSSYDRITVIDKKAVLDDVHQEINKTFRIPPSSFKAIGGAKNTRQANEKNLRIVSKNIPKAIVPLNRYNKNSQSNKINYSNKTYQEKFKVTSGSSLYKDSLDSSNYNGHFRYTDSDDKFGNDTNVNENIEKPTNERLLSANSGISRNVTNNFSKGNTIM